MIAIQRRAVVDEYRQFSFNRNSVAFDSRGRLYYPHQARFETISGRTGVLVEEGTSNLLTANQSSVETDTTGFVGEPATTTISRDTAKAWHGAASLKVVTTAGASYPGAATDRITASPNTAYSGQVQVNFPAGEPGVVWLQFFDSLNTPLQTFSQTFTGTGGWQRVTVTGTSPANTAKVRISVRENRATANGITYWVDGLQIEQKSYPTSWTLGTRAAETLTVPTAGVLYPQEGTIEGWIVPISALGSGYRVIFDPRQSSNANTSMFVYIDTNKKLAVSVGTSSSSYVLTSSVALSPNVPYYVAFTWSPYGTAIFVNGQLEASSQTPPDFTVRSTMFLGGNYVGVNQLNGLIGPVRISRRARTDQEIADAYAAGTLTADADTTLLLPFTGPDVQRGARVIYVPSVA